MTSISGAKVWEATYKAFGEVEIWAQAGVVSNLRFPGQYYDGETGLHYNYHRYYTTSTGRYIRSDPLGFNSHDINHYSYAGNNSISLVDPNGLAKYQVYWNAYGASRASLGCIKLEGVVVAKTKNCDGRCKNLYEAGRFEGELCGAYFGLDIGGTGSNSEEFEDDWGESSNIERIESVNVSGIHSATIAIHKIGFSWGYYQFGELKRSAVFSKITNGYELSFGRAFGHLKMVDKFCVENWDF
jgi:RHS repeat-associated protein